MVMAVVLPVALWEKRGAVVGLVADHGMQENDPGCKGDWDVTLRAAGIDSRDEAYGFLYFGVPSA